MVFSAPADYKARRWWQRPTAEEYVLWGLVSVARKGLVPGLITAGRRIAYAWAVVGTGPVRSNSPAKWQRAK